MVHSRGYHEMYGIQERDPGVADVNPFVDYPAFIVYARYCRPMGSFPQRYLKPLGERVLKEAKSIVGRVGHRGASRAGMYLKWELRSVQDYQAICVLTDRLKDLGVDVTVVPMASKRYRERSGDYYGPRRYGQLIIQEEYRQICYVKLELKGA